MSVTTILQHVTVEPILFLYMLLVRMEMNALQELIYTKSCLKVLHPVNVSDCNYASRENLTEALKEAIYWGKYNSVCLSSFTLLTGFYVASWSDRVGRKVIMLVPVLGTLISSIINCILSIHLTSSIEYLFITSTISGLTFGIVGIIASTFGYVADLTTNDKRTIRIVILEAMIFIGGTCGIEIGGLFLKNLNVNSGFNNFAQLFVFEGCVAFVIVLYTLIRIPGQSSYSSGESNHTSHSCLSLFSLKHILESFRTVFKRRPDRKRRNLLLLLLALVFIYMGFSAYLTLAYYFVKNEPLKWSFSQYSLYDSIQTAIEGILLLAGLPLLLHYFRLPDHFIGILGTISRIFGFIVLGLSRKDGMVYSCAALFMFSEFVTPTIRSMLSKIVDNNERGKIFAFTTILQNICHLCGSLIFNSLFHSTISYFPGLSFELVAGLNIFTLIIFCFLFNEEKQHPSEYKVFENDVYNSADSPGNIN